MFVMCNHMQSANNNAVIFTFSGCRITIQRNTIRCQAAVTDYKKKISERLTDSYFIVKTADTFK